ncbi:hypothetical protein ABPG72_016937 [Tetrahymena utriculariae]
MCDNCVPNIFKLQQKAKYLYKAMTSDQSKEINQKQIIQNNMINQLFQSIYPQTSQEQIKEKQIRASLSCNLNLKQYFSCKYQEKDKETQQVSQGCDEIVENIKQCVKLAEMSQLQK